MSVHNSSNGTNGTTRWVVGAVLSALLAIAAVMGARTYDGANVALALAPIVGVHTQKIETLEKDSQDSKVQNGIINNKLDLVLDELKELKKSK